MGTFGQRRLSPLERYSFMDLIKNEYASKGLSDPEFARYASEKLGIPISSATVGDHRKMLNIPPSYRATGGPSSNAAISELLENLEARLGRIEAELGILPKRP